MKNVKMKISIFEHFLLDGKASIDRHQLFPSHFRIFPLPPLAYLLFEFFMAKTKASATASRASAPTVSQLSDLAKHLRQQKAAEATEEPAQEPVEAKEPVETKEPATSSTSKRPSQEAVASTRRTRKGPDTKKDKLKVKKTEPAKDTKNEKPVEDLQIYAKDLYDMDEFDPSELDFQLKWSNFGKLKAFYALDDRETCTLLLAMAGATSDGKKHWGKFNVPWHLFDEDGTFVSRAEVEDEKVTEEPKAPAVKLERPKQKEVRSEVSQGRGFESN